MKDCSRLIRQYEILQQDGGARITESHYCEKKWNFHSPFLDYQYAYIPVDHCNSKRTDTSSVKPFCVTCFGHRPPLCSSGQSSWLLTRP
jgi:hypothetical protein